MSANKLVETIRAIVRSELNKTLKPMLKEVLKPLVNEMVQNQVNSVLAEKFIQNLGSGQQVVAEAPVKKEVQKKQQAQFNENRRQELMRKLGVGEDPMASLIYGDIDVSQPLTASPMGGGAVALKNGQVFDPTADDDGIDISQFGL